MSYSISARVAIIAGALALASGSARAQDVYSGNSAAPISLTRAERPASVDSAAPVAPGEGPYSKDEQRASVEINPGDEAAAVPHREPYGIRLKLRGVYDDNTSRRRNKRPGDDQ